MLTTDQLLEALGELPVPDIEPAVTTTTPPVVVEVADPVAVVKRCSWCNVALRWWQKSWCHTCAAATHPPCASGERTTEQPDLAPWRRRP